MDPEEEELSDLCQRAMEEEVALLLEWEEGRSKHSLTQTNRLGCSWVSLISLYIFPISLADAKEERDGWKQRRNGRGGGGRGGVLPEGSNSFLPWRKSEARDSCLVPRVWFEELFPPNPERGVATFFA